MSVSWYYVEGSDRVGPVVEEELKLLVDGGKLDSESYVWRKGLENWEKIGDLSELEHVLSFDSNNDPAEHSSSEIEEVSDVVNESDDKLDSSDNDVKTLNLPPIKEFSWNDYNMEDSIFSIKIGADRGTNFTEYGPYSMNMIKRLFKEKRISPKTYIFTPGLDNWIFLADIPVYSELFTGVPPVIEEDQRRLNQRKPFVARMLFHNNNDVFEGICRDISIGGIQVLISGMDVAVGDSINMNVHPTNSDYCFVASGKIVRVLEGKQGFSLRFDDLSKEAFASIGQYVEMV
jgi:hypothetical protein